MNEDTAQDRRTDWNRRRSHPSRPSRSRPLSEAARALRSTRHEPPLGPYETRYVVQNGYGVDRPIIRP